jgi:hypothetical protein
MRKEASPARKEENFPVQQGFCPPDRPLPSTAPSRPSVQPRGIEPNDIIQATVEPNDTIQATVEPNDTIQATVEPNDTIQATVEPNDIIQATVEPNDMMQAHGAMNPRDYVSDDDELEPPARRNPHAGMRMIDRMAENWEANRRSASRIIKSLQIGNSAPGEFTWVVETTLTV